MFSPIKTNKMTTSPSFQRDLGVLDRSSNFRTYSHLVIYRLEVKIPLLKINS